MAALLVGGLTLAAVAGVGGLVAAIAGTIAQPLLGLAIRHLRGGGPVTAGSLRTSLPPLLLVWVLAIAGVAAVAAWPLAALLESGSLTAAVALSAAVGLLLLGLWRVWPLLHAVEASGGAVRETWGDLGELERGAWRGLVVAMGF
ncbi:MAG: hypothetical protein H0W24_06965, partial [Lysobacter sp.]|nr:hypothetical protein [Lysobacter sp.]